MQIGGFNTSVGSQGLQPGAGGNEALGPKSDATEEQGSSFGDAIKKAVLERPSETHHKADDLASRLAAGENIDPHAVALATAKASIEIQFATRGISQAVSGLRTLMQMQI
jgi:flagellar hook-basal body complex protein FliE